MKLIFLLCIVFFSVSTYSIAQININDLKGEWTNDVNDQQFFIKIKKGTLEVFECGGDFKTGYAETLEVKGDTLLAFMNCRGEEGIEYTLIFVNPSSMILKGRPDISFRKKSSHSRIFCP